MDKKKSAAADNFGTAEKKSSASTTSKGTVVHRRATAKIVQNVLLIWLDSNIDDSNADCYNTTIQLRRVVNAINTFTDSDSCIEFIETMNKEKVCMIISGSLGQHTVPCVHHMSQVDSIFIFCGNKKHHEQWAKEWSKIKGVFTEISPICEALKQAAQQCEQNAISISFVATSGDVSNKNLNQLDPSFMYTQILKEILLTIKFKENHIKEFIDYCRVVFAWNNGELDNVNKLERAYHDKTPVWWYTYEGFLYPMLNRALRLMDVDIIIKMGFFIGDLHRHVEQLHSEQFNEHHAGKIFTVYRGQGLSKTDFDQLTKTKGGLISFNNFLSTSKKRDFSLSFARHALPNPDLVGILFVMTIDSTKSTTPFASITDVSYYQDAEDEVLFSMHTVFRIREIEPMNENNRLFQVDLTLTSDNDKDLRVLTDRIREETFSDSTGWYRLGSLLLKMGQFDKAQQLYEVMLDQTTDESEKGNIYDRLGLAKHNEGDYKEAITFYEKSLEIYRKTLPSNHPSLATSFSNIGGAYESMGEYSKALSFHEKALEIYQKTLPPNHPDLATSYNNIGGVYDSMGEYYRALSSLEKAFEIKQKSLPPNHPNLAVSYNNIGMLYNKMDNYSKALSSLEKALEIYQKTLPPNHPNLTISYNNIGLVYDNMGEYLKALSFHEKALEIRQKTLPPNHPDLATSYNNIGLVYDKLNECSKALWYHEKAPEIYQKTLPPNHPHLAASLNNTGEVYFKMGDYLKAYSFYERALDIEQRSLPANHPHIRTLRENIEKVKRKL